MRKAFSALAVLVLANNLLAQATSPHRSRRTDNTSQPSVAAGQTVSPASDTVPVTTSSEDARALYEAGIVSWENLQLDSALKRWRTAVNIDPDFALAHLMLAYCTPDPAEEKAERRKAESLAGKVTPDERLLIAWF